MEADITKVLLVTKDSKLSSQIKSVMIAPLFALTEISDLNEARRQLMEESFKIILVDFADGSGLDFATDISESNSTILLLIPNEHFDHISYKVEPYGILPITKPFDQFYFYNMIKIALAVQAKIDRLLFQNIKLKNKMEEIRIVNRAKMVLMSHKNMTEEEAHRYIEQTAMNRCMKKIDLAKEIISLS